MTRPSKLRSTLISTAKITLAGALIFWLIQSGRLNFANLDVFAKNHVVLVWCLIHFFLCSLLLGAYRWHLLLKTQGAQNSFATTLKYTSIGYFFNASMPGAIGGDVIKTYYLMKDQRQISKTSIILTVFTDRVMGLMGLFTVGSAAIIMNFEQVATNKHILPMIAFTLGGAGTFILCIALFMLAPSPWLERFDLTLNTHSRLAQILKKIKSTGTYFRKAPKTIFQCWLISVCIQLSVIIYYAQIARAISEPDVSFSTLGTIIPLGTMAATLPVAPAGLGVGHVAFETLFQQVGIQGGADIFNIQIIGFLGLSLIGVLPYLAMKNKNQVEPMDSSLREQET